MRRGLAVVGVAVAVLGGVITQVGTAVAASKSVRGVTPKQIVVEGIGPLTSATGGYPGVDTGTEAAFARINKMGGIDGRKIKYLGFKTDGEVASHNYQLVQQAVEQTHVFAVVPALGQGFLPASTDYLNAQHVPYYSWGFMPGFCYEPYGFGFNGCLVPTKQHYADTGVAAPLIKALKLKNPTVAIAGDNTTAGKATASQIAEEYKLAGATVVYNKADLPSTGSVNYTPYVQTIMTTNNGKPPDLVFMSGRFSNVVGLTGALKAAGYKGVLVNAIAYVPGLFSSEPALAQALTGSYIMSMWLPSEFGGTGIAQVKSALKAIGASTTITLGTMIGYLSASVFIEQLQAVGKNLTPQRLVARMHKGWTYKPFGKPPTLGKLTFPADYNHDTGCTAFVQVVNGAYKPVAPMSCNPVTAFTPTT